MAREVMLTTKDNPYDPFEQFDEWYAWDVASGYNTCGLLARVSENCTEFGEELQDELIEQAIDDFIEVDCLDLFVKAVKQTA